MIKNVSKNVQNVSKNAKLKSNILQHWKRSNDTDTKPARTHASEKASCSAIEESKDDEQHVLGQIISNKVNPLLSHLFEDNLNI